MKVLMLGRGKGSWEIRGQQLGAAIGARVTSAPTADDLAWADVAVIIKRSEPLFGPVCRAANVPIVWDALDFWRQPAENGLPEPAMRQRLGAYLAAITPASVLGATEAQAQAAGGVYFPHHSRLGLVPSPPRPDVQVVAYEGGEVFLGSWRKVLERICAARGWRFVVNPPDLSEADIIVALRGEQWDGWACREWKSGVKLVNAIAAGRPVITQYTAAVREIAPTCSVVETEGDLEAALDYWRPYAFRLEAYNRCVAAAKIYRLDVIAERFGRILEEARCTTA